jgi:hypothetical protein
VPIQLASEPGSAAHPNEDCAAADRGTVVVVDGVTARTASGCVHGVAWFAGHLARSTLRFGSAPPADALRAGIRHVASLHADTCDLDHPATPAAAVGIVQVDRDNLRYLVLGDVTVVVDTGGSELVVTDHRVDTTARAERAAADGLPTGSAEKAVALVRMKRSETAARNRRGGFWIAGTTTSAVDHALTGAVPVAEVRRVAVLTDGAARAVDLFGLLDWRGALTVLESHGPRGLIARVREIERSDPEATRWPRNKVSDDATAVFCAGMAR